MKTLPNNLEAEQSVLSAIILNNALFREIEDIELRPSDFYAKEHSLIFEAISELSAENRPIDLITLTEVLKNRGTYTDCGGSSKLTALFDNFFSTGNIREYAKIVQTKSRLRAFIQQSSAHIDRAFNGIDDCSQFFDTVEKDIITFSRGGQTDSSSWIRDIFTRKLFEIEETAGKPKKPGLFTGIQDFDRLTYGLQPGQLLIIAARPRMGKTALVMSMVQHMAISEGKVAAVFSLEMTKEELVDRIVSSVSLVSATRLKRGDLTDFDMNRLIQSSPAIGQAPIFVDDTPGITVWDIRSRARKVLAEKKRLDVIVVDYLQLLRGERANFVQREQEIAEISRGLKGLAKELKVPVIALSQLNRAVESRPDKRPLLGDLRESGSLEQDADMVCFIYRDEVYNPDSEDKGVAEFIVAKHRAGETGTIRLAWRPEFTKFENLKETRTITPLRCQLDAVAEVHDISEGFHD